MAYRDRRHRISVRQGQNNGGGSGGEVSDRRSPRAHSDEHADLLGPGVRFPRSREQPGEDHYPGALIGRSPFPRLLAHVSQGWAIWAVLVRVRRLVEGVTVATDRWRIHALR